jgi:hypothetical protein
MAPKIGTGPAVHCPARSPYSTPEPEADVLYVVLGICSASSSSWWSWPAGHDADRATWTWGGASAGRRPGVPRPGRPEQRRPLLRPATGGAPAGRGRTFPACSRTSAPPPDHHPPALLLRARAHGRPAGRPLMERARAGVRVLFLHDAFGSELPDSYFEPLREAGVDARTFRPRPLVDAPQGAGAVPRPDRGHRWGDRLHRRLRDRRPLVRPRHGATRPAGGTPTSGSPAPPSPPSRPPSPPAGPRPPVSCWWAARSIPGSERRVPLRPGSANDRAPPVSPGSCTPAPTWAAAPPSGSWP